MRARSRPKNGSTRFVEQSGSTSLLSFLSSNRETHFFKTFRLASLAFRPIPTCFSHSHSISHRSHPLSLILSRRSFSRNPLVTFNAGANRVAAYSNCHVNLVKSEYKLLLAREGRRFSFVLRFMPSYVTKESVENFIKIPRMCVTHVPESISVCDKLSATVEK